MQQLGQANNDENIKGPHNWPFLRNLPETVGLKKTSGWTGDKPLYLIQI